MILRPYQDKLDADIDRALAAGARNILAVSPTGGGKTVNMAKRTTKHVGMSVNIAHRHELVTQMSLTNARNGIRHRIIGNEDVARACVRIHMDEIGRSFIDPQARCTVAGVDTLVRRKEPWFDQVTLWQTDEAHHLLKENKWGKAVALFPNATGIGWTATPTRADGCGLGRHSDGVMDALVCGPSPRDLIRMGYLTDYKLLCPPTDLKLDDIPLAAGGDFSPVKLREATHKSRIVGDIVSHYLRHACGKLGITFAVDIEEAEKIAMSYRAAGVRAEVITGETPDTLRFAIMRRFRNRELDQIVSVDILGEGVDIPAVEVVSMGRATNSYALYSQQFGRALRLLIGAEIAEHWHTYTDEQRRAYIASSAKPFALILDHVGNWERHGLPDRPQEWSLDGRVRGARTGLGAAALRVCTNCTTAFERFRVRCPECGEPIPEPGGRGAPEMVDGDLVELDPAVLAALRGEVDRIDGPVGYPPGGLVGPALKAFHFNHAERQRQQGTLRLAIRLWAGYWKMKGDADREIHRRFFLTFGLDVMTAQTLNAAGAKDLTATVEGANARLGVEIAF